MVVGASVAVSLPRRESSSSRRSRIESQVSPGAMRNVRKAMAVWRRNDVSGPPSAGSSSCSGTWNAESVSRQSSSTTASRVPAAPGGSGGTGCSGGANGVATRCTGADGSPTR